MCRSKVCLGAYCALHVYARLLQRLCITLLLEAQRDWLLTHAKRSRAFKSQMGSQVELLYFALVVVVFLPRAQRVC